MKAYKRLLAIICIMAFMMSFTTNFADATTEITTPTVDYTSYSLDGTPKGFNIVYYDDIYSRGFSWMTDTSADDTELYVVESSLGENANFGSNKIDGTEISDTVGSLSLIYHKAHIENLTPGKTYSYKAGMTGKGYKYGTFTVDGETCSDDKITIIDMNDAQTKNPDLLQKWENTVNVATSTAGQSNIDFYAFGGDQFDHNMYASGTTGSSTMSKAQRWAIARDTVSNIVGSTPYIATSGNHDALTNNIFVNTADVNFGLTSPQGGTYSFDYDFMHFVVIDTNVTGTGTPVATLKTWLHNDLSSAESDEDIKWIVCLMHNGLYATGDHSNNSTTKSLIANLAPEFSDHHVDLVMQAHDHTFNKTLPYKWETNGYTTSHNDSTIVNLTPATYEKSGITYDINPNGTYYVTCGCSGHRVGEDGDTYVSKTGASSYYNNTYAIECDTIDVTSAMANKGDLASTNIAKQMFGKLEITKDTLSYSFYYVDGGNAVLYDTLAVIKNDKLGTANEFKNNASTATKEDVDTFLAEYQTSEELRSVMNSDHKTALRNTVSKYMTNYESERKTEIASINSAKANDKLVKLAQVQASVENGSYCNVRLIASTTMNPTEVKEFYFEITCKINNISNNLTKMVYARELYSVGINADSTLGISNAQSVLDLVDTGHIFGINIKNVPSDKVVVFTVTPKMISTANTTISGISYNVTFAYGYYVSCTAVS